jgi:mRNA interferase RelE/StbE
MYRVVIPPAVEKQLKKLDQRYISALNKAFNRLSTDPHLGKPLAGEYRGNWRLRFARYRIVYQIFEKKLIILIVDVLHRKDVYRSK